MTNPIVEAPGLAPRLIVPAPIRTDTICRRTPAVDVLAETPGGVVAAPAGGTRVLLEEALRRLVEDAP